MGGLYSFTRVCYLLLFHSATISSESVVLEQFRKLLDGTDRLISYYSKNHEQVNFDGLFGLYVLRDHLSSLIKSDYSWNDESVYFRPFLSELTKQHNRINSFAASALSALQKRDAIYYPKLGKLYQLHWKQVSSNYLDRDGPLNFDYTSKDKITEEMSDACLTELFRNYTEANACKLPNSCMGMLRQAPRLGYELTHQVLILLVLKQLECRSEVEKTLATWGTSLYSLEISFCSVAFQQFRALTIDEVDVSARDLVLEQILLCGSAGYLDFTSFRLLNKILSWQQASGCFSIQSAPAQPPRRKLLVEQELEDGCLCHMTSVAAGAMGVYLTAFLTPGGIVERDGPINLYGLLYSSLVNENAAALPKLIPEPQIQFLPHTNDWIPSVEPPILGRISQPYHFPIQVYNQSQTVAQTLHINAEPDFILLLLCIVTFIGFLFLLFRTLRRCRRSLF